MFLKFNLRKCKRKKKIMKKGLISVHRVGKEGAVSVVLIKNEFKYTHTHTFGTGEISCAKCFDPTSSSYLFLIICQVQAKGLNRDIFVTEVKRSTEGMHR